METPTPFQICDLIWSFHGLEYVRLPTFNPFVSSILFRFGRNHRLPRRETGGEISDEGFAGPILTRPLSFTLCRAWRAPGGDSRSRTFSTLSTFRRFHQKRRERCELFSLFFLVAERRIQSPLWNLVGIVFFFGISLAGVVFCFFGRSLGRVSSRRNRQSGTAQVRSRSNGSPRKWRRRRTSANMDRNVAKIKRNPSSASSTLTKTLVTDASLLARYQRRIALVTRTPLPFAAC